MIVIGIVGGIASGKSLVAAQFSQLGAAVLDGDEVAHRVLCEPTIKKRIRSQWGSDVFDENGDVSRSALAAIVFDPTPAGREQLEQLAGRTELRLVFETFTEDDETQVHSLVTVECDVLIAPSALESQPMFIELARRYEKVVVVKVEDGDR